jgi:hypothetical protein
MSFSTIGKQIIENKNRYKDDEETKNKLTYNFVTDPRLRRGHNYGVIYVTSSNYDENNENIRSIPQKPKLKSLNNYKISQSVNTNLKKFNMRIECKEKSFNDFGIFTEKVVDISHPKPISFEVGIQTEILPKRPVSPCPWPEKKGIDTETQIDDGELFNFDVEVAPLVQVIVSKTLEDSRREVLEEEEMKNIDFQMNKFKLKKKEENDKIKEFENEEKKRFNERLKKKKEKENKIEITKMFQQKLITRKIAKQYVNNLIQNSYKNLEKRGILKTADANDFYTELLPEIQLFSEENFNLDKKLLNIFELLKNNNFNQNIENHKISIINEKKRLENNQKIREILHERELKEIQRKKEERARKKHEKKLEEIRKKIKSELMSNSEWTEDNNLDNIYNINGYYQKNKCLTTIGGPIGQMAIFFTFLSKINAEILNEEKINKIIDLYIQKSHPFYFLYKNDDLEYFKSLDENFESIEDINKIPDEKYQNVIEKMWENNFNYDDMLKVLFDAAKDENIQMENLEENYKNIFMILLKKFKDGNDQNCVRFLNFEGNFNEIPLECVCLLNLEQIEIEPTIEKKKKNNKINFEHFFYEKYLMMPTISENMKIILINKRFDVNFKRNLLECLNKLFPIDEEEKNDILEKINLNYELLVNIILRLLKENTQKEIVEMEVKQNEEEEEEEEKEKEDEK